MISLKLEIEPILIRIGDTYINMGFEISLKFEISISEIWLPFGY